MDVEIVDTQNGQHDWNDWLDVFISILKQVMDESDDVFSSDFLSDCNQTNSQQFKLNLFNQNGISFLIVMLCGQLKILLDFQKVSREDFGYYLQHGFSVSS